MQPRCLARTQLVQRHVFGDGQRQPEFDDDADEPLSERQAENRRFWSAVLRDYAFSDVAVDVPEVSKGPSLFVNVRESGFGNEGLWFVGYLDRTNVIGCYLTFRKGIPQAERVFRDVEAQLAGLRTELGDNLSYWENKHGRPRIGFHRETKLPFAAEGDDADGSCDEAVLWMRDHLDRLVSALNPLLRRMLRGM